MPIATTRKGLTVIRSSDAPPPPDTPAEEQNEQTAYQTMLAMIAQVGSAITTTAHAVETLLGTLESADDMAAEEGSDREQLRLIVTNATAASEALASIVQLAQAQRAAIDGEVLVGGKRLGFDDFENALAAISPARLQKIITAAVAKSLRRLG
jgi:hypothetical protein